MISLGKLKLHLGVIILFIFAVSMGYFIEIMAVFAAVTLHETAHVAAAYICGGEIEEFYITPIGEIAKIKNFWSFSQYERIFILLCGPLTNIIIGIIVHMFQGNMMLLFSHINIVFAIFNIIPVIPLDGGNIVYSIMGRNLGVVRTAKFMTNVEGIFGLILMIVGVIQVILYPFNISLMVIGGYFFFSRRREYLERISDFYITVIDKDRDYDLRPMNIKRIFYRGDYRSIVRYFNYDDYFFVVYKNKRGHIVEKSMEDIVKILT